MKPKPGEEEWEGSFLSYLIGYGLSLILTLTAFYLVAEKLIEGSLWIMLLALAQFIVQLIFFLHLGKESKSYWNTILFFFMLLVVVVIVFGSLWIMFGLNRRVMPWMQ